MNINSVGDMDASGSPLRLDLFKATAARLVSDKEEPPLGSTWLRGFFNRHPELSSKSASGLDLQRALSSKPTFKSYRCSFRSTTFFLIIYM